IDPFPNCFSICERASSTALARSSAMAIREGSSKRCAPCASHAFPAGNGEGLELDFEGIVAGRDIEGQGKVANK
ncbi:MAG: hypothetical protein WBC92_14515, partial [Terracidiphilus sp.]